MIEVITIKKIKLVISVFIITLILGSFSGSVLAKENLGRVQPVSVDISCDDFKFDNHIRKTIRLAVNGSL